MPYYNELEDHNEIIKKNHTEVLKIDIIISYVYVIGELQEISDDYFKTLL